MSEETAAEKKVLDLGDEMPMSEGVETDEELLLARDLMKFFIKSIKAFRFYPPDNPTLKGFREQLPKRFHFFLNKYNSLVYQIGEYDFSFKGKVLYENRDIKASLAFLLYKDGLRELRFMKGLEEWEILGLMDLFVRSKDVNQLEDDFVTMMWEKDFIHIGHLATDEFLEDMPVLIPENVDQFRKDLVFHPVGHNVEVDLLEDESEAANLDGVLSKLIEQLHSFVSNRSLYSLTPEEVERLREEVEAETDPAFVFNVIDILFELLAVEKEPEPFEEAVNTLSKIVDALITLAEFRKAGNLLKRVYMMIRTHELKDWQIETLSKLIIDAGEEQRIDRIGRILEKEESVRLEDVNDYLVLLQRNSIKPLIKLLGERKKSKVRRVICDALSEIGKNAPELFTPFIDDPRWYLVRNITYILGRIGKEESLTHIQKAFGHEDVRVRREAVQALGLIGGSKAVGLLVKSLTDDDARIRSTAALNLGKVGKKAGLIPLLEVVQSKDFQKKDQTEMKAFFDAIGMVGSNESVPVLQQLLLEKKSWFSRGKTDETRIGAARTLATLGTPEAKAILEAGRNSKDESVRYACMYALRSQPSKESLV